MTYATALLEHAQMLEQRTQRVEQQIQRLKQGTPGMQYVPSSGFSGVPQYIAQSCKPVEPEKEGYFKSLYRKTRDERDSIKFSLGQAKAEIINLKSKCEKRVIKLRRVKIMPRFFKFVAYSAYVTLLWKIVLNIDVIASYLVHLLGR